MAFPQSGDYWFPRGLATLAIDRAADSGSYWEPNVWMHHPVRSSPSPDVRQTVHEYLDAYDRQLRTDAETPSAVAVTRLGPLRLVTFAGGRGFVTYQDLVGADSDAIARWVEGALAHYREDPGITRVEWKTREHDHAPGLHDALVRNGFVPGEPESIMIGEAALLAVDAPLPKGSSSAGSRMSRTSARSA